MILGADWTLLAAGALAPFARAVADAVGSVVQIIGMMVTVDPLQHFDAHAEEACGSPKADAVLHHPGRGGMAHGVWRGRRIEAGECDSALKGSFHGFNWFAAELDEMRLDDPALLPAPHVRQQTRRDGHRRLPFVGFLIACGPA